MKIKSFYTNVKLKKIFSTKSIYFFLLSIILILLTQNIFLNLKINNKLKQEEISSKANLMSSKLKVVLSNIEGKKINNIEIVNSLGKTNFSEFFNLYDFVIVVYQNGLVCDPCSDFLFSKWNQAKGSVNKLIYPNLITIGEKLDRKTQLNYLKNNSSGNYFIDKNKTIKNQIIQSDFPVNFVLLVDKNMRVVYATYFTNESKQNFSNLVNKANRYVN